VGWVGYIFQNPDYQIFSSTVREELAYGPKALRLPPDVVEDRVTRVARMLGIEHLLDEDPFFLQKSDRQRVAVASVLTVEPKILLLDEPTTGLSPAETVALMDMVKYLNELGSSVLVISHDLWVIARYCSRTILMHNGRIVLDGPTRRVFSNYRALRDYDIEVPQVVELSDGLFGQVYLTPDEFVRSVRLN
jgi:energy-coupling factor transporter ATP-binding protein EcfA2